MAPLPESNSRRWWLEYTVCTKPHTLLMRSIDEVDAAQASAAIGSFLGDISLQLRLLEVTGFRTAAKGSNVSVPAAWGGAASYGSGAGQPFESANFIDFVGRTEGGRRARAMVFGAAYAQAGGDYRVTPSEDAFVTDAIADLVGDPECWLAIDELNPSWNAYCNIGPSAYWRNKIR